MSQNPLPRVIPHPRDSGRIFIPRGMNRNANAAGLPVDLILTQLAYHPNGQLVYEFLFELPEPLAEITAVFENDLYFLSGDIVPVSARMTVNVREDGRASVNIRYTGDVIMDVIVGQVERPARSGLPDLQYLPAFLRPGMPAAQPTGPQLTVTEPTAPQPTAPGMRSGARDPVLAPTRTPLPSSPVLDRHTWGINRAPVDNPDTPLVISSDEESEEQADEDSDGGAPTAEALEYGDTLRNTR